MVISPANPPFFIKSNFKIWAYVYEIINYIFISYFQSRWKSREENAFYFIELTLSDPLFLIYFPQNTNAHLTIKNGRGVQLVNRPRTHFRK